ncbi:MAG: 50S ribosomal protein L32 [Candidatus Levybacteria bacterium]|nr:50S ribosomal protein L32 [Candidatus Levybacteria bacterium]
MPQEPKKRHSRARQGKRRAVIKLERPSFIRCLNCKEVILPHVICKYCGFYKGKRVVALKEKEKSKEDKTA